MLSQAAQELRCAKSRRFAVCQATRRPRTALGVQAAAPAPLLLLLLLLLLRPVD